MKSNVLIFLVLLGSLNCFSQNTQIDGKETFFYTIKANKYSLGDKVMGVGQNWVSLYATTFDMNNFNTAKNDEFQIKAYTTKINNEMRVGINSCDFRKKFITESWTSFGEYDFNKGYFPIDNEKLLDNIPNLFKINNIGFRIKIAEIINFNEFNFILKMDEENARKFVNSRKDINGKVDRRINTIITYSIFDKKLPSSLGGEWLAVYAHKIVLTSYSGELLGELTPKIRLDNRNDTIYYDSKWQVLNNFDRANSKFYRIINYNNGEINGAIKDYFISGALQMVGYFINNGTIKNGHFTWYYENGQKSQEAFYTNDKLNGKYTSWYDNGQKKEEVNYINDKKDGCDCKWFKDGEPDDGTYAASWGDFWDYYVNGDLKAGSSKCPCSDR